MNNVMYFPKRWEASLNWLALGLLLAAWNAADDARPQDRARPAALRGYETVSVRAIQRACVERRITNE
jgi:hypothetical protein